MAAVISLAEAKTQLRIPPADFYHDPEIQAALEAADAMIRKYLKSADDPTWDATTAPLDIKQAVKLMTAHVYEHRGDAFGPDGEADNQAWAAVANVLRMWRDPALA